MDDDRTGEARGAGEAFVAVGDLLALAADSALRRASSLARVSSPTMPSDGRPALR